MAESQGENEGNVWMSPSEFAQRRVGWEVPVPVQLSACRTESQVGN